MSWKELPTMDVSGANDSESTYQYTCELQDTWLMCSCYAKSADKTLGPDPKDM